MSGFKVVCCQCGSANILEKSSKNKIACSADNITYFEGIQRMCLDCSNESFVIFKTWVE